MALENTNDEACDMVEERTFTSHNVSECVKRGDYILKRKKMPKEVMLGNNFELFGIQMVMKCLELRVVPFVRLVCCTKSW